MAGGFGKPAGGVMSAELGRPPPAGVDKTGEVGLVEPELAEVGVAELGSVDEGLVELGLVEAGLPDPAGMVGGAGAGTEAAGAVAEAAPGHSAAYT